MFTDDGLQLVWYLMAYIINIYLSTICLAYGYYWLYALDEMLKFVCRFYKVFDGFNLVFDVISTSLSDLIVGNGNNKFDSLTLQKHLFYYENVEKFNKLSTGIVLTSNICKNYSNISIVNKFRKKGHWFWFIMTNSKVADFVWLANNCSFDGLLLILGKLNCLRYNLDMV